MLTTRHHFTHISIAKIKQINTTGFCQGCGTPTFSSLLVACKMKKNKRLWRLIWELNMHLHYDLTHSTHVYSSKRNEYICPQKDLSESFCSSFIHNDPTPEAVQMPITRRMDKKLCHNPTMECCPMSNLKTMDTQQGGWTSTY